MNEPTAHRFMHGASRGRVGLRAARDWLEEKMRLRTTQLEQTAAKLREQADLLDLSYDAIMVHDMAGVLLYWNRGAESVYGWTGEQAVGSEVHDLLQTRFPEGKERVYRELAERGRWEGDLVHTRRDGTEIIAASRWALQRDDGGQPLAVLEITSDVTAQRQAQQQVAYQAYMLANVNDALIATDVEGRITVWNHAAEGMYGRQAAAVLGRPITDLAELGFGSEHGQEITNALVRDGRWRGEVTQHHRDGAKLTCDLALIAVAENGAPRGYVGVGRDISDCKRAQAQREAALEALRESESRLRLQLDRMPIACMVWDTDTVVQSWNPAAERVFGFTAAEAMGKRAYGMIVPAEISPELHNVWQRLLADDNTAHSVNENLTKDGRTITCEWTNTPLKDQQGQIVGVLSMANDISDRKNVETALREERARLACDLHDSVTQSLYSLTLFGDAGHQQLACGNVEQADHYLARISETAVQALKEMRLLVYQLRPTALEDQGLVRALEYRLSAVERRAGVKARLLADEAIWLPASIAEGLYRVAQEALNNVLKHANATEVIVQLRCLDRATELSITDNGQGFDPAAVSEGGLGLISMREHAEKMGGTLTIRSAPAQGTTVTAVVRLPESGQADVPMNPA